MVQYPASKLLNVLFAMEYARRCPYAITINSANPGYTESELGGKDPLTGETEGHDRPPVNFLKKRYVPCYQRILLSRYLPEYRETYEGAKSLIHAAIADIPNGVFVSEMRVSRTRSNTLGDVGKKFAHNVWTDSLQLLKAHAGVDKFEDWVEK